MMKKITLALLLGLPVAVWAQCTTTNATACQCQNSGQSDCDLLPDITVSGWALLNYLGGPTEYPQTGAGADNGRLRLSGSTPNIGHGPLTVGSVSLFVCGTDTFTTNPGTCPDGSAPKQLIKQKIYHKNGNLMSYSERWAGSMTYHPTHGHMHVDDWGVYTLRIENPNEPDPRNWPIVGSGSKLGFCLMDYGTCSGYNGHCRDSLNNILLNSDFVNFGLGGGAYNCSPVEQGISSGYTDIYSENLDGMWINIPPGTCNGNYWIVIEIDPHNYFLEEDETNNWAAVPFTLTQQVPAGQGVATITPQGNTHLCAGDALDLTANAGFSYEWSTGDSTQTITVNSAGTYSVIVNSPCGIDTAYVTITQSALVGAPSVNNDTLCGGNTASFTATGTGPFYWYDAPTGGNLVGSGPTYTSPSLSTTTQYYVESQDITPGTTYQVGPLDATIGTGANHTSAGRYLEFTADEPFTLVSAWVRAAGGGNRTIELQDNSGATISIANVNIPDGDSRVNLNLNVPQGNNMRLVVTSTPNLWRNDGGVAFPYDVADVAHITNSSAGTQYYYFFYDWEIETLPEVCSSTRATATAYVYPSQAVTLSGVNSTYTDLDPPVTLIGTPSGGTFSGPGVSGNTFTPASAGVGGPYTLAYSVSDSNGCVSTATTQVTIFSGVGVLDALIGGKLAVWPNPHTGTFHFAFGLENPHQVAWTLQSLTGQVIAGQVLGEVKGSVEQDVDVTAFAKGVYILKVEVDAQAYFTKVVFQ